MRDWFSIGYWLKRIKGRNRKRVGSTAAYSSSTRFNRKEEKFGPQYRPGKLFKGHRI